MTLLLGFKTSFFINYSSQCKFAKKYRGKQKAGSRKREAESGKQKAGSRKWEVGRGKQEVRSGKWEVRSGKREVGNREVFLTNYVCSSYYFTNFVQNQLEKMYVLLYLTALIPTDTVLQILSIKNSYHQVNDEPKSIKQINTSNSYLQRKSQTKGVLAQNSTNLIKLFFPNLDYYQKVIQLSNF